MNENILLVEPAYRSKYPPLGLMKLSTYHRSRGDKVVFVRGCSKEALNHEWSRIYITSLFTYTWDETVKTIRFYKNNLLYRNVQFYVGGILATLMPQELADATGVQPITGLLDNPRKLSQPDNIIIDHLPPDYDILEQVSTKNFQYNNADSYIGYATRGCVNRCKFCAVAKLEPEYIPDMHIGKVIKKIIVASGEKQNLLLMDNNVLASQCFDKVIDEIKAAGFEKDARYGANRRRRVVDFNQGLDARLLTEQKMKRLSEIPLDPMRIAFDNINQKDIYCKAVRLAHKYGQRNMSNYILYNYHDTPDDFYERLKINIDLNEEFAHDLAGIKTVIYSFPMRYIPLNAKSRTVDTGNINWNRRYLRAMKLILNVTKGPVMPGSRFFYQAFGRNADEFKAIMLMPDEYIRNRLVSNWRDYGNPEDYEKQWSMNVSSWMSIYRLLSESERQKLIHILGSNDIDQIQSMGGSVVNDKVKKLLTMFIDSSMNSKKVLVESEEQ